MMDWSVYEVSWADLPDKTQHLVGYMVRQGLGRVSSAVQAFDRDNMRIKTLSGLSIQLKGLPGFNSDADYLWIHWKTINAVKEATNVTNHYCLVH